MMLIQKLILSIKKLILSLIKLCEVSKNNNGLNMIILSQNIAYQKILIIKVKSKVKIVN